MRFVVSYDDVKGQADQYILFPVCHILLSCTSRQYLYYLVVDLFLSLFYLTYVDILEVIYQTREYSVSSGYPNTERKVENTTCSGISLTKFEVFVSSV